MDKIQELENQIARLQEALTEEKKLTAELNEIISTHGSQQDDVYSQVNRLLLWKCALKVRVNEVCPFKDIIGKEGYLGDLFPNGWTVVHKKEDGNSDFWRLDSDWLDVVLWDEDKFQKWVAQLEYQQIEGQWLHKSQIK